MKLKTKRLHKDHYEMQCACGRTMHCAAKKVTLKLLNGDRQVKPLCNACLPPKRSW